MSFFIKYLDIQKMDKNKCPKSQNQNTFHFRKTGFFSTYEGKKFYPLFREFKEFLFRM